MSKRFLVGSLAFLMLISFPFATDVLAKKKSRFEKLELFNKVLYLIESRYYREVSVDKLIQGAIKGMMGTLDPHSAFLDDDLFAKMQEDTKGEFGGLGIEVTIKDGIIIVTTPIEDTPAYEAGMKSGDRIVEIDGDSMIGVTLEEAVQKMRGDVGTKIMIGVHREGEEGIKRFTIERKVIKIKPVRFQLVQDKYAYVRLSQFQKDSGKEIANAIKKLKKRAGGNVEGIVLDLRANPGGLLDEAVKVSSIFLRDGIVVSTEARDPKQKEIKYVLKTGYKDVETPIAVLINGASASASEIVAGALQDHKRALVVGTQSFGKGSVQTIATLDGAYGVKLTIAQYMTPKGTKIQAVGIKPDVKVEDFEGKFAAGADVQEPFLREKDLKNHLTATIESEEEKKERLVREKKERQERIREYREKRKRDKDKKNVAKKTKDANEDYMVVQSVRFLQAFKKFKALSAH